MKRILFGLLICLATNAHAYINQVAASNAGDEMAMAEHRENAFIDVEHIPYPEAKIEIFHAVARSSGATNDWEIDRFTATAWAEMYKRLRELQE